MGAAEQRAKIERIVSRLCLSADLRTPSVELVVDATPLSWTTALPGGRARLHVTTGMVALLGDAELEAVIAHELSHVGNRDAMLMTVLAAPGVRVLRGLRAAWHQPDAGLHAIPDRDLRVVAAADVLHVVPAKPARGIARMWATHPPLKDRIARLEQLEQRLQA